MCFGGKKKKGPSQAEIDAANARAQQEALINDQRNAMLKQQEALVNSQKAFQDTQNALLTKIDMMNQQAFDREAQQFEALTAAQHAASLTGLVQTGGAVDAETGTDEDNLLDSQRRGRRALRIDLNAPTTTGSGGSGLNIPRG